MTTQAASPYRRYARALRADDNLGDCAICQHAVLVHESDYVADQRDGHIFHAVCFGNARVDALDAAKEALRPFAALLPLGERQTIVVTPGMVRGLTEALAALEDE